tara:strand:+ start:3837 stop:4304 length:468 start_codon:yes stop_codon:yes gene_type:complete
MKPQRASLITHHSSLDRITLLLALFCISASSGFLSGRLATDNRQPTTFQIDTRPPIPTIHIKGIRNGLLHGSIKGSARVVIDDFVLTQSGVFALDASALLTNEIAVIVPDFAQFVASNRGKKYYPVFSSAGERIIPKNRIYFQSKQEAELEGYLP